MNTWLIIFASISTGLATLTIYATCVASAQTSAMERREAEPLDSEDSPPERTAKSSQLPRGADFPAPAISRSPFQV